MQRIALDAQALFFRRRHQSRRATLDCTLLGRLGHHIIGAEVPWFFACDGLGDDDGHCDDGLGQSGCRAQPLRQSQRRELEPAALWASGGSPRQHQ